MTDEQNLDTPAPASAPAPSLRAQYADWPQKNDTRAQPWDLDALGVPPSDRDAVRDSPLPNTISPIVIGHRMPILSSGSGMGDSWAVNELARRLHVLGYQTSSSAGRNPWGVLDDSIMTAVEQFRQDHGVEEDPTGWGGNTHASREKAAAHVGPWTWEALIRASDRATR